MYVYIYIYLYIYMICIRKCWMVIDSMGFPIIRVFWIQASPCSMLTVPWLVAGGWWGWGMSPKDCRVSGRSSSFPQSKPQTAPGPPRLRLSLELLNLGLSKHLRCLAVWSTREGASEQNQRTWDQPGETMITDLEPSRCGAFPKNESCIAWFW